MTWTYSGDPATSQRDYTRLLIGDTDQDDQLLSDEEIDYLIQVHGTIIHVASEACHIIAAKFARLMSRSIGGLSADFSAKYRQYIELAENFKKDEDSLPVGPFISGYTRSAKEAVESETDRETTFSRKGIMDNNRVYPADDYGAYDYRRV